MYLQKIEIQGFKSFGKKTVFEFPEKSANYTEIKSISAIVGPNGAGKSNVVDAVRWVFGEQSMKLLRGKKTEDIIFSGSHTKARLGAAEVSIYLNNEDPSTSSGRQDIEMPEIVITRRVFRDGDGEYLINKKKVRLFDVLMLLAKANFGQKSFGIIGQGMVDHVINMSVFDRKDFFDEATGVKQFQIKRDQAASRLKSTSNNLEKVNGILSELEPRLRLLSRQVKRLEKRRKIEDQLKDLQKKYYSNILLDINQKKTKLEADFSIKDELKSDLETRMRGARRKLEEFSQEESRKDVFNNLQKEFNKLNAEKNELLQELAILDGKMNIEYVKKGQQNLAWLQQKKSELNKRALYIKEALEGLNSRLQNQQNIVQEKENQLETVKNELTVLQNNLLKLESQVKGAETGKNWETNHVAQAVLRQKNYIKGIEGTVAELFKVKEDYQKAAFVSVGLLLNAIVVKDAETAVRCINYLKQNQLGSAVFIPLDKIITKKATTEQKELLQQTGAIEFLNELVECDEKHKKLRDYLFSQVVVVDNLENARKIKSQSFKLVTLDGEQIASTGIVTGGFLRKVSFLTGKKAGAESRDEKFKEISLAKSKIEELIATKERLVNEVHEEKIKLEVARTKEKGLRNDLAEMNKEQTRLEAEINEAQIDPKQKHTFLKNLESKKKEFERQMENVEEKILQKKEKIDKFNIDEEKKTRGIFEQQKILQTLQEQMNKLSQEINYFNVELGKLGLKHDNLTEEIQQELGDKPNLATIADDGLNVDAVWHDIGKLKHQLEMIGGIDQETVDEYTEVQERHEFLSAQVMDLEKAINDLEKVKKELDGLIQKQFEKAFKKINQEFNHYFAKIFQGGKARLDLLEFARPDEQTEETVTDKIPRLGSEILARDDTPEVKMGIDVSVNLPNKKISTISMLSGGEKTMTSIALICAIVASNPSPFVIFDEIDAALDEANSERLADILKDLAQKTQFLLITHNRVIMHVADVLYGVTMGKEGISHVVSMDFAEAEKVGAQSANNH